MRILCTGGAGYCGCVLVPLLLEKGYKVRVLDNLMYGGDGLLPFFSNPNFEFARGDIRAMPIVREVAMGCDVILHLAAIVGYPACKRLGSLASDINVAGTEHIAKVDIPTIFASTQSVYGIVTDSVCTEEMNLNPQSSYAHDKYWGEHKLLEYGNATILRFPTAFGLSPRMRLDLLVNDFVYKAITDNYIAVYQPHVTRAFIHVWDMANAYLFSLEHLAEMTGQVYNVGSNDLNYTKRQLAEMVVSATGCSVFYRDFEEDLDKRNYRISCAKIVKLGYETQVALITGIQELVQGLKVLDVKGKYANA